MLPQLLSLDQYHETPLTPICPLQIPQASCLVNTISSHSAPQSLNMLLIEPEKLFNKIRVLLLYSDR